jgi:hypothetical protein
MPTPAWNPGTAAVLFILERTHPGPARGEVNVIEGGRRVAGNSGQLAAASPVGPLRSLQDRATRKLQSVCGSTLGRGTASGCACQRHAWTTRSRIRTMPDGGRLLVTNRGRRQLGVSVRTVERLVAASRPDKREARLMPTCASYPPIGLGGWAASAPDSPFHWFRAALHHSAARRTNGHTALTTVAHRFHLTCAICRAAPTC